MNITIVGLGLIGGSFAKATKSRTLHTVMGCDLDDEVKLFARLTGAIDKTFDAALLPESDLILVALRPHAGINWLRENASQIAKTAVVVDMCGTKREVCAEMGAIAKQYGFMYVGGHPMAGKECGGFVNATENLYDGASMILTPDSSIDMRTLELLKNYFTDIGFANLTFSTPEEHDEIIAYTSQLAHIVSGAYVKSPTAAKRRGFSAGSFKDMTRVARLDEDMWTELMMQNSDFLCEELATLIANLNQYREALLAKDPDALRECLKEGRLCKANAGGN